MALLRVAIIGLGMAAAPHAQALLALRDKVEVAAAFSPSPARRRGFSARYGLPVVADIEAILSDGSISAVLILTPPDTHLDLASRVAQAGKHVLLEKPLEITLERAKAVVNICRKAGVQLGVVLQNRYRPASTALLDIVHNGRLGPLVSASLRVDNWRSQEYYDEPGRGTRARDGGGVLLTQAIHAIDLFLAAAGLPAEIAAHAVTSSVHHMETEDTVAALLRFPQGAIGTLSATTCAYPGLPDRLELIGVGGSVRMVGSQLEAWFHDGTTLEAGTPPLETGGLRGVMDFGSELHQALILDFIDAIGKGRVIENGNAALAAQAFIATLLQSSSENRPLTMPSWMP